MLQIELIQIDRVKSSFLGEIEPDPTWKEHDRPRRCNMQFLVYSPGVKLEDVVDAIENEEEFTLYSCGRNGNGYSVVIETDIENWRIVKNGLARALKPLEKTEQPTHGAVDPTQFLEVAAIEIEIGSNLNQTVIDSMPSVHVVRTRIAGELGFIMPPVRVSDGVGLDENTYNIKVNDEVVATGQVFPSEHMALFSETFEHGTLVDDPVYGQKARWISAEHCEAAVAAGLAVISPSGVLVTHLNKIVKDHAGELLRRQQVYVLVERLKSRCPQVVAEVIPTKMEICDLHLLLQAVLNSGKSIRHLELIFEALGSCKAGQMDLFFAHLLSTVLKDKPEESA